MRPRLAASVALRIASRTSRALPWPKPTPPLVTPGNVVMERTALAQRHANEPALGGFRRLADRFRHFARLAVAEADAALLDADHHQRGEAETPAALHHLRHAVDVDELVGELAV